MRRLQPGLSSAVESWQGLLCASERVAKGRAASSQDLSGDSGGPSPLEQRMSVPLRAATSCGSLGAEAAKGSGNKARAKVHKWPVPQHSGDNTFGSWVGGGGSHGRKVKPDHKVGGITRSLI